MIWVSWRQSRLAVITLAGLIALIAVYLIHGGLAIRSAFENDRIGGCLIGPQRQNSGSCPSAIQDFYRTVSSNGESVLGYLNVFPALLGVFLGAPLIARELENGTHRLAWTQSVTRTRWVGTRLAVAGLLAITAEGLLSQTVRWWGSPLSKVNGRFDPNTYDFAALVPLGYALLAFAIGAFVGVLLRRMLAAMVATLALFVVGRLLLENYLRPRFQTRLTTSYLGNAPSNAPSGSKGDWLMQVRTVGSVSHHTTIINYQPASRYWNFQLEESGICLVLSITLLAATTVWARSKVR